MNAVNPEIPLTGQQSGNDRAKDRPTDRRFVLLLLPVYTAQLAAIQGVQQILIPAQVEALDPASKIANLGMVTALAAVTAMVGVLAGGIVSDRTSGRWGRRSPSLAGGALISAAIMLVLSQASGLLALAVIFASLWFSLNYYQGALSPTLPDRVPPDRRGVASAVVAVATPLGVIVGVNIASHVSRPAAYAGLASGLVLATVGMLLLAPEKSFGRDPALKSMETVRVHAAILSFFSGFRSRNFALVFAARALMFFSVWNVTGYIYFIAQDFIGVRSLPGHDPQLAVSTLISLQMVACIVGAVIAGVLVDRLKRTKLVVAISSVGMAAALTIPLVGPTWTGMLVMEACVGLFFGTYLAVDLALMTLVLPNPDGEGKDMAVLNIATGGPQILSPITGAALISVFGYPSLFLFGSLVALGAGVLVLFVKNVR